MLLSGFIEKIIFSNQENGYTVCLLETSDGEVCIVGIMPLVAEGEFIEAEGDYVTHATYGRQFVVASFDSHLPVDETAMLRYLSSGIVKGIREKTARQIINTFGRDSFDIIENNPEELSKIKGITLVRAHKMSASMKSNVGVKNILLYFQQFGITPVIAFRLYKMWGASAYDVIRQNPYKLCEVQGLSFEKVDEIADRMSFDKGSKLRISAGIQYVLTYNLYNNGHSFLPKAALRQTSANMLEVEENDVAVVMDEMSSDGKIVYAGQIANTDAVYLKWIYDCETNVARRLILASKFSREYRGNFEKDIAEVESDGRIKFSESQKKAIKESCCNSIMILTGGPGTGKTTTLNGILSLFENKNISFAVAAPTGRAAKRITELSGRDAKTIHRLLECSKQGDREVFGRNRDNQLKYDAVIIDESSMIDLPLFNALLEAVPVNSSIILLGDANQLPPVGPGSVFKDIVKGDMIATIELQHIFRQAEKSLIVTNAHRIINGEFPIVTQKDNDFFYIYAADSEEVTEKVADLYCRRLPAAYGYESIKDIQVLCPSRKTTTGSLALNQVLRDRMNPAGEKAEITFRGDIFREGDKVMQIRNNYDITYEKDNGEIDSGVFNGDIGVIEKVYPHENSLDVRYDDKVVNYTAELLEDLTLAYAITVHKSQGSEFPAVILPLLDGAKVLYTRNLLYTAVTRAKTILIIVGTKERISQMVNNNVTDRRYSGLKYRITEMMSDE